MDVAAIPTGAWLVPVTLSLLFAFSNGFRDSSTIVATVVSTGTLSPSTAFGLCGLFEFLGALLIGSAIMTRMAAVIGASVSNASQASVAAVLSCALLAALIWGFTSWWRAWPISNSQALIGGLTGAAWVLRESGHLVDRGTAKVFLVLICSPILGFVVSTALTSALRFIGGWMTPLARTPSKALHVLGCLTVSAAHGSNDGQMTAALVASAMAGTAGIAAGHAPGAVRLSVAAALTGGVLFGGRRILRKLGMKFYRIREIQGVGAQLSASATILACLASGFPASTTQVVSGSIVGAGVAKNARSVRWLIVREIVASWLVTVPATALLSAALARLLVQWGKA